MTGFRRWRILLLAVVATLAAGLPAGCLTFSASVQSAEQAAATASQFAGYAFIEGDTHRAYLMLAPELAKETTEPQFMDLLTSMHPQGRPGVGTLRPREIELAAGRTPLIAIYFETTFGGEAFFYQVVVQGGTTAGYRVVGFRRSLGPLPPSNRTRL